MKVYCHGFKTTENGLLAYKGLNTIEDVEELIVYNEKGRVSVIFESADYEAVAIFAPTTFVVKKNNRYFWSEVLVETKQAKTIDNLANGKNYVKKDNIWMLIEEF